MKTAITSLLMALLLPAIGVPLIDAFATGTSSGEDLINTIGPLVLWLLPVAAIVNLIRNVFAGD